MEEKGKGISVKVIRENAPEMAMKRQRDLSARQSLSLLSLLLAPSALPVID